jgi:hypothetical protein
MPFDFALDADQANALRKAVVEFCDQDDIEAAHQRYPGERPRGEFPPRSHAVSHLLDEFNRVIELENAYFSSSFLLRVLEQKWIETNRPEAAQLRADVLLGAPGLVRPSLDMASRIQTISTALAAMLARIPVKPQRGNIGDVVVFDRFCRGRDAIQSLATVLAGFSALKSLQDHLVMLRVQGAPWLAAEGALPALEPLNALVDGTRKAAMAALADLPASAKPLADDCIATCSVAAAQLQRAAPEQLPAIVDLLNGLLARAPRQVQSAMFTVSRDLPLRVFRGLFAGQDEVVCAVIDLCDGMRRRLMQYWLFEQLDDRIERMRDIIADPDVELLAELNGHYKIVDINLRGLIGDGAGQTPLFSAFAEALVAWDLQPDAPQTDAQRAAHAAVLEALDDLRDGARAAGLKLDQQLRTEIGHLDSLRPQLADILRRLPFSCMGMVPS